MCQYQTLYHDTEQGYIVQCQSCRHIQLAFGNIGITYRSEEFYQFQKSMNRLWSEIAPAQSNSLLKNISVPTPCEGIVLLFSPKELRQLISMLDSAETELRSQELISLFG